MTEEQPTFANTPEPEYKPTPPTEPRFPPVTKLDDLPLYIKKILNGLVKAGYGSQKTKTELERQFDHFEDILPASRGTYEAYIYNHYDTLMADAGLEAITAEAVREGFQQAVQLAESVLGEDGASKKQQIESLKNFMVGRIEFLERSQSNGLPSATLENTIATYVNGVRTLIEKSIEYGEELSKEDENQVELYMEGLIDEFVHKSIEIYKNLHGDNKLKEFEISLATDLGTILKKALQQKASDQAS